MFDIWDVINSADFGTKAKKVLASLDATDPWLLAVPIFLAVFVGSKIVSGQPNVRRLGLRLGAAAFLTFGIYRFFQSGGFSARVAVEAANAGGLVLAVTWTLLPIVTFVYAHLRLALAAFIGYTGYELTTAGEFRADQLPDIALRGLAAVGLVLLVAWILHPIWDFFRDMLPRPRRAEGEEEEPRHGRRSRRRRPPETRKIEPEPTIHLAAAPTLSVPPPAPALVPPPAPAPVPPPALAPEQLESQRRRDRTRLQIEMAYVLAFPRIGDRFPRVAFDDFVRRFLGDHLPPEDVEANGRQLQEILQEHQRQTQDQLPPPAPPSDAVIALLREEQVG